MIEAIGAKRIAAALGVSQSNVYKWAEHRDDGPEVASNPVSRVVAVSRLAGDPTLVQWIAEQAGGFFVENPGQAESLESSAAASQARMVGEFSHLLAAVAGALDEQAVAALVSLMSRGEGTRIRREWEAVKRAGEKFVTAIEAQDNAAGDP